MNDTFSLDTLLNLLSGLSLDNRVWLAEHLVNPAEKKIMNSAKDIRDNDCNGTPRRFACIRRHCKSRQGI